MDTLNKKKKITHKNLKGVHPRHSLTDNSDIRSLMALYNGSMIRRSKKGVT